MYPQLEAWNRTADQWVWRISIVSLIHSSGKNAVFMPLERVLPLVTRCLEDDRDSVQKAVGWVLRETGRVYPDEVRAYLEEHIARLGRRVPSAPTKAGHKKMLASLEFLQDVEFDTVVANAQLGVEGFWVHFPDRAAKVSFLDELAAWLV